jgi:16S rRNA processing protein RimM
LYVKRGRLPELEPGAFYHEDLAGLTAIDEAGSTLGTVAGIVNYGAGDLIEVARLGERDTLLVPFTEQAVPIVDLTAGTVTIIVPDFAEADGEPETGDLEPDG